MERTKKYQEKRPLDAGKLKQLCDRYKIPESCRKLWLNEISISNLKEDEPAKRDAKILGLL